MITLTVINTQLQEAGFNPVQSLNSLADCRKLLMSLEEMQKAVYASLKNREEVLKLSFETIDFYEFKSKTRPFIDHFYALERAKQTLSEYTDSLEKEMCEYQENLDHIVEEMSDLLYK